MKSWRAPGSRGAARTPKRFGWESCSSLRARPALDPSSGALAGPTFELQARQAFENLRAILEDAGSRPGSGSEDNCFLAVPEAFDQLNALYAEYFPVAPPVRSTPVVQLPRGLLFSIEAIAAVAPRPGTA